MIIFFGIKLLDFVFKRNEKSWFVRCLVILDFIYSRITREEYYWDLEKFLWEGWWYLFFKDKRVSIIYCLMLLSYLFIGE